MASLKDLRNRISSVKATRKITKAMQMVAAAKLRRAQEAAVAARPFGERMNAVLSNLARGMTTGAQGLPLLSGTGKDDVHLLIVATAERGLCGGFNASIAKLAREHINKLTSQGKQVKILCVGKKGADALRRQYGKMIIDQVDLRSARAIGFDHAKAISDKVQKLFAEGQFDVATIFYAEFKSVISQVPTAQKLIPADVSGEAEGQNAVYEYEPGEEAILADLLPRNISVQIFRALLENSASEQGARMSAMDNATRNAGDMINQLTLKYNRQRQAQITKELIEIISGAEAL
jgi:F-type H+-transporting ATPase subunit gamma